MQPFPLSCDAVSSLMYSISYIVHDNVNCVLSPHHSLIVHFHPPLPLLVRM